MMSKNLHIPVFILILGILLSSFNLSTEFDLPIKKINKAVDKIWDTEEYTLRNMGEKNCNSNGCWYEVVGKKASLGMIYAGRVNSCRSGGCSFDNEVEQTLTFEFFDYFMLTDTAGKVLWVKIYNYRATQGHEVMSRGWLNQFKGLTNERKINLGEDIETISGATISAQAITDDIQHVIACY